MELLDKVNKIFEKYPQENQEETTNIINIVNNIDHNNFQDKIFDKKNQKKIIDELLAIIDNIDEQLKKQQRFSKRIRNLTKKFKQDSYCQISESLSINVSNNQITLILKNENNINCYIHIQQSTIRFFKNMGMENISSLQEDFEKKLKKDNKIISLIRFLQNNNYSFDIARNSLRYQIDTNLIDTMHEVLDWVESTLSPNKFNDIKFYILKIIYN